MLVWVTKGGSTAMNDRIAVKRMKLIKDGTGENLKLNNV